MISVNLCKELEITINANFLTYNNTSKLLTLMNDVARKHDTDIIINLENVSTIDSSAIAMLVKFMQRLSRSKRKMTLINVAPDVLKILNLVNLSKFFKIIS